MYNIFTEQEMEFAAVEFEAILALPLDAYQDYLFTHKPISLEAHYWKAPTPHEIDSFPIWRKMSYDVQQCRFAGYGGPTFTHYAFKQLQETRLIVSMLNSHSYYPIWNNIINDSLTDDYYNLANFFGIIDHIKEVQSRNIVVETRKYIETFADYLTPKGQFILPFLKEKYKNKKAVGIVCMLHALKHYRLINNDIFDIKEDDKGMANFQRILNGTFENTGSASGFRHAYQNFKTSHRGVPKAIEIIKQEIANNTGN